MTASSSLSSAVVLVNLTAFSNTTKQISQFPVGKISDLYDRRLVIVVSTFGAALFALLAILVSRQMYLPDGLATSKTWFYIFLILFSFCSLPMFSLILAHTNDYIPKEKFVAMPQTITPAGIELNPQTEPIQEPNPLIESIEEKETAPINNTSGNNDKLNEILDENKN